MYKLCFFVPWSHLEVIKKSLFDLGAGKSGYYDQCCWQTKGHGQYRPLSGSTPYSGNENNLSYVEEYKVEIQCPDHIIDTAIETLKHNHPYETPVFEAWKLAFHG